MKNLLFLTVLLITSGLRADNTHDEIYSITRGKKGDPHLIKLKSGAVEFLEHSEQDKLEIFEKILAIQSSSNQYHKTLTPDEVQFEPTPLSDDKIETIFKQMNPFIKRKSECTDRAHVWAWDEYQRNQTNSQKAFLFLTDTYIKRHRYKWWFHVAPMFTSTSGQKFVTDVQFLNRPVTFSEWKNFLVFSKRECVTEFSFLEYNAGADQSQDCYVKFLPMFYRIPGDIGNLEQGRPRTDWNVSEVNASRSRAFFKGSN